MKFKKINFLKLLGLGLTFVAIPTISIASTSCSTVVKDNTSNGDTNNGGDNSNQEIIDPLPDSYFEEFFELLKFNNDTDMVSNIDKLNDLVVNSPTWNKQALAIELIKCKYGMQGTKLTDKVFIKVADDKASDSSTTIEKAITDDKLLSKENIVGVTKISTDNQSLIFNIKVTKNANVLDPSVYGYLVNPFPTGHQEKYTVVQKIMTDTISIKIDIGGSNGLFLIDKIYKSNDDFLNDIHNYKEQLTGIGLVVARIDDGKNKGIAFSSFYDNVVSEGSNHLNSHIKYDFGDNCPNNSTFWWINFEF